MSTANTTASEGTAAMKLLSHVRLAHHIDSPNTDGPMLVVFTKDNGYTILLEDGVVAITGISGVTVYSPLHNVLSYRELAQTPEKPVEAAPSSLSESNESSDSQQVKTRRAYTRSGGKPSTIKSG